MGGLGVPEIIIIMVIGLIVFGPRKLPELGKSLGKAMNQFRRASEDFKRTWEQEVDLENTRKSVSPTSESSSSTAHSSSDSTYNPYSSDTSDFNYGYTAPSDAELATTAAPSHAETPVTETPAPVAASTNKPQPGQWI